MTVFLNCVVNYMFKIKFAYVTNDTSEISIRNHIHHCTTQYEMIICDSDGITGISLHITPIGAVLIFLANC
jgi:hypothetical protein